MKPLEFGLLILEGNFMTISKWNFYILAHTYINLNSNLILPIQVLSLKLDQWTNDEVSALAELGGNASVNKKYEAYMPSYIEKPKPTSSTEERNDFIR